MGTGSPGSVWVLHLLNAEPDPGYIVRTAPGADHVCNQRVYRDRVGLTARSGNALRSHSGWTRVNHGYARARMARVWQWPTVGTAALGQGTANGADAGHEQGGSTAGAHDNGGSGLGRCGSGSGRKYWCMVRLLVAHD